MTERAQARHRADLPPLTALTGLTTTLSSAVGDHAAMLGRGGMVIAVSSGLVAGMGLPAGAQARAASGAAPQTASVPLLADTATSSGLAAGAEALASTPVSAPAQARVTFDHGAFTAVPRRGAAATSPASATRAVDTVSRSLARSAYLATRSAVLQQATTGSGTGSSTSTQVPAGAANSSVVAIAMRYLGVPYRYGGTTPRGFDCSGFTQYVFAQLGISLARSADGQYQTVPRISRSQAQPGDLVFYLSGGSAYHVGIYLGGDQMIAAPHTGAVVRVQAIYSSNIAFGRP
ncbi:MAG TPA: C40 family peptidase [Kineosporiaceae bacterium]|nr:C40 family peptidase [Kineosporiaceae bacterium]